jgi:hypothetical protein
MMNTVKNILNLRRKQMKRIVFALLALTLLISMVSCGEAAEETVTATKTEETLETTTEETKTENDVGEAVSNFARKTIYVGWQLQYLENNCESNEEDLDLIEVCKNWSRQELSAFIAEVIVENQNNCSYATLHRVTANHGFDRPFDAAVTLMDEGLFDIVVVDGEVCYVA